MVVRFLALNKIGHRNSASVVTELANSVITCIGSDISTRRSIVCHACAPQAGRPVAAAGLIDAPPRCRAEHGDRSCHR
jgi:hypothetical protein